MNVTVLEHKSLRSGLLQHKAKVRVDDYNGDTEELVFETSIKSGYHPSGYGLYGRATVNKLSVNEYEVAWSTGTHCD